MALSNVDFDLCFTGRTRCRPKKTKKTLPLQCRVPPLFYNGKSTFSTSDFCNTRLSNVDFALYFMDAIWCFLKKHQFPLIKPYFLALGGLSFGPCTPLVLYSSLGSPKGGFRSPFGIKKVIFLKENNNFPWNLSFRLHKTIVSASPTALRRLLSAFPTAL